MGESKNFFCQIAGKSREARSGQYDRPSFRLGVVGHSTLIVPNHRSVGFRICRLPFQAEYAGVSGCCKRGPGCRHILCQYLRFGRIAGSLFATLRIIEAELEIGCVPGARQSIENRALPSEVVSEGWRCIELMLQFGHLYHIVAHAEAVQSRAAAAHV
jgi:hypothetical protein